MTTDYAFFKALARKYKGHVLISVYSGRASNGWNPGPRCAFGYVGAWTSTELGRLLYGLE